MHRLSPEFRVSFYKRELFDSLDLIEAFLMSITVDFYIFPRLQIISDPPGFTVVAQVRFLSLKPRLRQLLIFWLPWPSIEFLAATPEPLMVSVFCRMAPTFTKGAHRVSIIQRL